MTGQRAMRQYLPVVGAASRGGYDERVRVGERPSRRLTFPPDGPQDSTQENHMSVVLHDFEGKPYTPGEHGDRECLNCGAQLRSVVESVGGRLARSDILTFLGGQVWNTKGGQAPAPPCRGSTDWLLDALAAHRRTA